MVVDVPALRGDGDALAVVAALEAVEGDGVVQLALLLHVQQQAAHHHARAALAGLAVHRDHVLRPLLEPGVGRGAEGWDELERRAVVVVEGEGGHLPAEIVNLVLPLVLDAEVEDLGLVRVVVLEELDDVQKVFSNADFPDEVLDRYSAE